MHAAHSFTPSFFHKSYFTAGETCTWTETATDTPPTLSRCQDCHTRTYQFPHTFINLSSILINNKLVSLAEAFFHACGTKCIVHIKILSKKKNISIREYTKNKSPTKASKHKNHKSLFKKNRS